MQIRIPMGEAVRLINDAMKKAAPDRYGSYTASEINIANAVYEAVLVRANEIAKADELDR